MLLQLPQIVLNRPRAVLALTAAVVLFGTVAFTRLPVEHLPRLEVPVITVTTVYPSVPPAEVEQLVTVPLENALAAVSGVTGVESVSTHGKSMVAVRFAWGTDIGRAAVEIRERIDAAVSLLPKDVRPPAVLREDLSIRPVAVLAAVPHQQRLKDATCEDGGRVDAACGKSLHDRQSLFAVSRAVENGLAPQLRALSGIGRVAVLGAVHPELRVQVDPQLATAAGMSLPEIATAIADAVVDLPVGRLSDGEHEYPVRVRSGVATIEQLRELRVGGTRLGRLAALALGPQDSSDFFHTGRHDAVGIAVYPQPGTGVLSAATSLQRALPELSREFSDAFGIEVVADNTQAVRAALNDLMAALIPAVFAASAVLLLMRRNAVAALLCAAVIPVSLALSAAVLFLLGVTVNIISLAGIVIGIGMLLDNAVVVSDSLALASTPDDRAAALGQAAAATFGGTATTVFVFFPIALVPGPVGAVFADLAVSISTLLAASYVVSLTFLPAATVELELRLKTRGIRSRERARGGTETSAPAGDTGIRVLRVTSYERRYRRILRAVACRWAPAAGILLLTGGAAILLLLCTPGVLLAEEGRADYILQMRFARDRDLSSAREQITDATARLRELQTLEVWYVVSGEDTYTALRSRPLRQSEVSVTLMLSADAQLYATEELRAAVSTALAPIPHLGHSLYRVETPIETLLGGGALEAFHVRSDRRETLGSRVVEVTAAMRERVSDELTFEGDEPLSERIYSVEVDHANLAQAGLEPADLLTTLQHAIRGEVVTHLPEGGTELPVRLILPEALRAPTPAFEALRIKTAGARFVPLGNLAALNSHTVEVALERLDRRPARGLTVTRVTPVGPVSSVDSGTPVTRPRAQASDDLRRAIVELAEADLDIVPAALGALRRSRDELVTVFALAFALLFLLLAAQLDSFLLPLLVLATAPAYALGGVLSLSVTGTPLSISSLLGLLVLMGTAVNSAILLTVAYRSAAARSAVTRPELDLVVDTTVKRSRSAVAAFTTTAAALIPVTVGPLAGSTLVSGTTLPLLLGLLLGTPATLLLFPAIYLAVAPGARS